MAAIFHGTGGNHIGWHSKKYSVLDVEYQIGTKITKWNIEKLASMFFPVIGGQVVGGMHVFRGIRKNNNHLIAHGIREFIGLGPLFIGIDVGFTIGRSCTKKPAKGLLRVSLLQEGDRFGFDPSTGLW